MEHAPPMSKLPRRSGQHPSVADLVKRYQDFLPAPVSTDLARSSFPASSQSGVESDQETPTLRRPPRPRVKSKPKILSRKDSVSDFEHSYAANVAPRYLASRRATGVSQSSRIPGPVHVDSRDSSRRTSPDKRPSFSKRDSDLTVKGGRPSSPPRAGPGGIPSRAAKSAATARVPRDRSQPGRVGSMSNVRNAFRKASNTNFGGKVSNIARQFERMNKDFERATRRYAVIRGRRARPVASSKATVEVFDSVKDAIKDVSDVSGESSSEADDEGEDDDDGPLMTKTSASKSLDTDAHSKGETALTQEGEGDEPSGSQVDGASTSSALLLGQSAEAKPVAPAAEAMPSPFLQGQSSRVPSETPSPSDVESTPSGMDRPSTIMKALSGFLPNHLRGHFEFETDDPMADPEHIFRESSMVVRTDEPTSIIALALK